jgi:type IV secretion system protein VirD4
VDALISNTKGEGKEGDPFWTSATRSLTVKSQRTNNKIPLFG